MPSPNLTPSDELAASIWEPGQQIRHLRERALLTSGVCIEISSSEGEFAAERVQEAIITLKEWIESAFDLPSAETTGFHYGLSGFKEVSGAEHLVDEVRLGASVCENTRLTWWSDSALEAERDRQQVVESLERYFRYQEEVR